MTFHTNILTWNAQMSFDFIFSLAYSAYGSDLPAYLNKLREK